MRAYYYTWVFVSWNATELGCPGDRTLTAYNPAEPAVSADLL